MRERQKTKGPRISPEAAIRAALEVLDEEGLDNVTLRKIASKIGIQAPTLYWHFKNKSDLIDDMAEAILKDGGMYDLQPPKDKNAWTEWLTQTAHTLRRAMLSHRDGGRIVAGASFRSKAMQKLKLTSLQVLHGAGFDHLQSSLGSETITDYVWGYVIEEQANPTVTSGQSPELSMMRDTTDSSEMMLMDQTMDEWSKHAPEELFNWGLQTIISGLKMRLENERIRDSLNERHLVSR
ncbi:MAG: TetR/AcrR family transcriptional regulator C-terminal domain-containing protein [Methanomassiliicoccus sp.]|nr:TetR/AcrR family transcriptional regulator C-terminal domain-containing protein [Methanomassiliicoccus sp.]